MNTQNKRLAIFLLIALSFLLIPVIAMQVTSEVNWTGGDFLVGGFLLVGSAFLCELTLRKSKKKTTRILLCLSILFILLLVWAEGAVGIFS